MIAQHFARWYETASNTRRAEGIADIARNFLAGNFTASDGEAIVGLLGVASDDPSPKVRATLAAAIGSNADAPRTVVRNLLRDCDAIALLVVDSPLLLDDDLLEVVGTGSPAMRKAIAERHYLSLRTARVLASDADLAACEALIGNKTAYLDGVVFSRIAERYGRVAPLRWSLLERADLPVDVRQALMLEHGQALLSSDLVSNALRSTGARRVIGEICDKANATLAGNLARDEIQVLVEHLRASGQISPAFLVRLACLGNVDFFAAILTALSGMSERRVRAIVVDGRDQAFTALLRSCALPEFVCTLLRTAVRAWKDAVRGRLGRSSSDVPALVMQRVVMLHRASAETSPGLSALLNQLELETWRDGTQAQFELALAA